nr:Csa1 family protein [Enterococcus ureilyticus]
MSGIIRCEKKTEIEQRFDKVFAMYQTKNLEDFYEGKILT